MTSAWVFVHLVRTAFSIFHSLKKDRNHVVDITAIYNDQILDKKTISWIPPAM